MNVFFILSICVTHGTVHVFAATFGVVIDKTCKHHEIACPVQLPEEKRTHEVRFVIGQLQNDVIVGNLSWKREIFSGRSEDVFFVHLTLLSNASNHRNTSSCFILDLRLLPQQPGTIMADTVSLDCVRMIPGDSAGMLANVYRRSCDVINVPPSQGGHNVPSCSLSLIYSSLINIGRLSCEYYDTHHTVSWLTLIPIPVDEFVCFKVSVYHLNPFANILLTVHPDREHGHHPYVHVQLKPNLSDRTVTMSCQKRQEITSKYCYAKIISQCPGGGRNRDYISEESVRCTQEEAESFTTRPDPATRSELLKHTDIPVKTPPTLYIIIIVFIIVLILIVTAGTIYMLVKRRLLPLTSDCADAKADLELHATMNCVRHGNTSAPISGHLKSPENVNLM